MKRSLAALAALSFLSSAAAAQSGGGAKKPTPISAPGLQVSTTTAAPRGSTTSASDLRALQGETQDPFELERIGLAAVSANELDRARVFFERAWKLGELPTAAYNLACLDARKGRDGRGVREPRQGARRGLRRRRVAREGRGPRVPERHAEVEVRSVRPRRRTAPRATPPS